MSARIMPYHSYSALTDADARAVAAFLKSLAPVVFAEEPRPTGEGETPAGTVPRP